MAYTPRLPPRQSRPKLPAFKAPAAKAATIYHWGQSNPALAAGSRKVTAPGSPAASAATPAPSQPVTPAPSSAALPPDPSYDQTVGALGRQRDTTLSGLASQRTTGLLNYGYTEDAGGALAFDPTNPYSQAAQMKLRYDQSRKGTGNSMASRGQLYAGAYQQGQDIINRNQGQSEDALQKALIGFLAGNTGARGKAQTDYELGLAGAEGDRISRAGSNPLYSPTAEQPVAGSPAAATRSGVTYKLPKIPVGGVGGLGSKKKR